MKLIIEGQELTQAIRRGLEFDLPGDATITIITGRGSNEDRAEIEWATNSGATNVPAEEEPPFEVADGECAEAEIDPAQQALPLEDVANTGEDKDPFA